MKSASDESMSGERSKMCKGLLRDVYLVGLQVFVAEREMLKLS